MEDVMTSREGEYRLHIKHEIAGEST